MKTALRLYDEKYLKLDNILDLFMLSCEAKNLSPKTISWYKQILSRFFDYIKNQFMIDKIPQIDPDHIRHYITYLKDKPIINNMTGRTNKIGLSSQSIKDNFAAIKVFFNYLLDEKYIQDNPFRSLEAPRSDQKIINLLHRFKIPQNQQYSFSSEV